MNGGPARETVIGALLDWIKKQPDLDADRVMVQGVSHGGFMALSVAVSYSDRIRAALSDSGPSNLVTFEKLMTKFPLVPFVHAGPVINITIHHWTGWTAAP